MLETNRATKRFSY